ncbi:MAG: ABC transporter permease [Parabacteroides sp.]|nr:ABC transporter permease [Parabacteroides sp.]
MIKHIIKIIWTQRSSNILIWLELLFVSIFLWYIVDYMYVQVRTYFLPLGYNIESVYLIQLDEYTPQSLKYAAPENKATTSGEDLLEIVNRIRQYPGIEAVSVSRAAYPYNMSNTHGNIRAGSVTKNYIERHVSPGFFSVFGCRTSKGEGPEVLDAAVKEGKMIITAETEKELFDGHTAGERNIYFGGDSIPYQVGPVLSTFRYSEFQQPRGGYFLLLSEKELARHTDPIQPYTEEVCVRVKPGTGKDFPARFRKDMASRLQVGNVYLLDVKPFSDQREAYFSWEGTKNELKTQTAVMVFLLVNIILGIVGTFWVRTASRKSEMGLRVALGDTPSGLKRLLVTEGIVLLAFAAVPAILVSLNLGMLEIVDVDLLPFSAGRFLITTFIAYLLLTGMIITGIWYPARNAAKIQPAEALHYE